MIFLIEYSRSKGIIVTRKVFEGREREKAANARLDIELDLHKRRVDHEVVLLEAESEEALRRTHRRYFEDPTQILRSSTG